MLYLVNKAGSVLEDKGQRGLAHFMEHMNFNGTKHFSHNELGDYLQKAGVQFGADINAYTSFDETVYELPIPSDKPELLKGGLEIMRDWAHEALLDPGEIDMERGVGLEEKRLGKGAGEKMRHAYWPVILNDSRYAELLRKADPQFLAGSAGISDFMGGPDNYDAIVQAKLAGSGHGT
jgi:zinc protease